MPTRLRKVRKQRGSRTHGYGQIGQHRHSGKQGGHGNAGPPQAQVVLAHTERPRPLWARPVQAAELAQGLKVGERRRARLLRRGRREQGRARLHRPRREGRREAPGGGRRDPRLQRKGLFIYREGEAEARGSRWQDTYRVRAEFTTSLGLITQLCQERCDSPPRDT